MAYGRIAPDTLGHPWTPSDTFGHSGHRHTSNTGHSGHMSSDTFGHISDTRTYVLGHSGHMSSDTSGHLRTYRTLRTARALGGTRTAMLSRSGVATERKIHDSF
jgi:hypothetical protein